MGDLQTSTYIKILKKTTKITDKNITEKDAGDIVQWEPASTRKSETQFDGMKLVMLVEFV